MITKSLNYNIQRNISCLPIHDDIYVYRDEHTLNGNVFQCTEWIARQADLESVQGPEIINKLDGFLLCKKTVVDIFHKNSWNIAMGIIFETDEIQKNYIIDTDIYNYVQEHGSNDLIAIKFNCSMDGYNYDIHGNRLPRAFYFNDSHGGIHNDHYDLEDILEILEKRTDISFIKEGINLTSNPFDGYRKKHLEFVWIPSLEDFEKVKHIKHNYEALSFIKSDIFGFPPEKDIYDESEDDDL